MIVLKTNVTLKSFLVLQLFDYCLKLSLPLNKSISWMWVLFHLYIYYFIYFIYTAIARRNYKQVIGLDNTWLLLHKNIQNDAPVDCTWSSSFRRLNILIIIKSWCSFSLIFPQKCLLSQEIQGFAPHLLSI